MLYLYLGAHGVGKTYRIGEDVLRLVRERKRAFLIVPEQYTLESERSYAKALPPSAPLTFEVTNFSRLANTVFRAVGGLSYRYATKSTQYLFLWQALSELLPELRESGTAETGRVRRVALALSELHAAGVGARELLDASDRLSEGDRLRDRLYDLAVLDLASHDFREGRFDDAAEDLDRLARILEKTDFFKGSTVFVDSFTSFTEQEYRILRLALRQCDVHVALTLPTDHEEHLAYRESAEAMRRLLALAKRTDTPVKTEVLTGNKRTPSPLLSFLSENMFRAVIPETLCFTGEKEPSALSLVTATDAFEAADYIAADIRRRVMNGARYRDFAVVARHAESYVGILDVALDKCEIPHYMSTKVDITSFEAVKMIFAAYAVINGGFREKDVISYLKCNLSGISADARDRFELYVSRWKISGERRYLSDTPFTMNPSGFTTWKNETTEEILSDVNETRDAFRRPFFVFLHATRSATTVEAHCKALLELLLSLSVPETLAEHAAAAKGEGRLRDAEEMSRLWDTVVTALDALCDALSDVAVTAKDFPSLLRLVFAEADIGRIPSSADAVTVGSADMLRAAGAKRIYLYGVNEGEFPASVTDDSVFSDNDKKALVELGIPLEPDLAIRSSRELYSFLRAFSAASESVTAVTFRFDAAMKPLHPSQAFVRIASLAADAAEHVDVAALPEDALLYAAPAASDRYGLYVGNALGDALRDALSDEEKAKRKLLAAEGKVTDTDCRVTAAVMEELYGKHFTLTQSKLESYVKCPFQYFCRYVLRLEDEAPASFDFRNIGSFVHAALEHFFKLLADRGVSLSELPRDALPQYAREVTALAVKDLAVDGDGATARLRHLTRSIERRILLLLENLCEEFSQSEFLPRFFEMPLSSEDGPSPVIYTLPDGTRLSLRGTVDRVDSYYKDGKMYLRVVDYKTGSKRFSVDDVEKGVNLQLLVYLFSLWKNTRDAFRDRLGVTEGDTVLPAGVLYMMASTNEVSLPAPLSPDAVREEAKKQFARSGLFLDDRDVLTAMEADLRGRYIPVSVKTDGDYTKKSIPSLASLAKMGELSRKLDEVVTGIGSDIRCGKADASPTEEKGEAPCKYCEMRRVCRRM